MFFNNEYTDAGRDYVFLKDSCQIVRPIPTKDVPKTGEFTGQMVNSINQSINQSFRDALYFPHFKLKIQNELS